MWNTIPPVLFRVPVLFSVHQSCSQSPVLYPPVPVFTVPSPVSTSPVHSPQSCIHQSCSQSLVLFSIHQSFSQSPVLYPPILFTVPSPVQYSPVLFTVPSPTAVQDCALFSHYKKAACLATVQSAFYLPVPQWLCFHSCYITLSFFCLFLSLSSGNKSVTRSLYTQRLNTKQDW